MSNHAVCSGPSTLIFACSGAADVGALADTAARELMREGIGKMFCTAGVGGRVAPILKVAQDAETIVALDGCPLDCVKNLLDHVHISNYRHVRITDLGFEKGKSGMDPVRVNTVKGKVRDILL